ncbi:pectate lyase [Aphelenchoides avenae]|nr:pectate lyase [Aphelenchus avenae]
MCSRIALVVLFCVSLTGAFDPWPNPPASTTVPKTVTVKKGTPYDGKGARHKATWDDADGGKDEDQPPLFSLEDGAVIRNAVLGAPAADGIHCNGFCTFENVWWEDVGEDAATFLGTRSTAIC